MVSVDFERLLNRQEASAFLGERGYRVAVASLNKWASTGGGPKFRKFGRRPLYAPADLIAWAQARTSPPVRSVTESEAIRSQDATRPKIGGPGTADRGLANRADPAPRRSDDVSDPRE
jgi:hypothetical protein